ncbi:MAG: DUF1269 domain-containing protein [Thermoguttaceae bacterium]|jgi:uncharacterized membrane protein|nr:DUF1269 domain-containing protein [Thermoguttaceae bacterium]
MATLTVLKFGSVEGADQGLVLVQGLQKQALIKLHDAAVVSWPQGARKPKTRQLFDLASAGAWNGAFWGMLFGLIFFVPFFGAAIGGLMGALAGHFADYGIDDRFIQEVRGKVTQGTSALFLLTSDAVKDRVVEAAKTLPKFEIVATNLSEEQEQKLREAFA